MSGLTIIVATAEPERFRAALTLALAAAALGGAATLYCHERSVSLLASAERADDESAVVQAAGLPDRLALLAMAREAGVTLIACQTGMAMAGVALGDFVPGVETGGMIGLLAERADDRLVGF